jgi:hypothetical protein
MLCFKLSAGWEAGRHVESSVARSSEIARSFELTGVLARRYGVSTETIRK